jgi:hypothetical protein
MAINVKTRERATVSDSFVALYRELAEKKLRYIMEAAESRGPASRKFYLNQNKTTIGRLAAIVKNENEPGRGIDFEITRLRGIDVARFGVLTAGNKRFLVAETKSDFVVEEMGNGSRVVNRWDTGPYRFGISEGALLGAQAEMHYIPLRKPEVQDRHFHHYATKPNNGTNPWLYEPYSCVAQFGAPLSMALAEMDVVELFRLMRIFVGRYFNGSPLRRPEWSAELRSFARRIA